MATKDITDLQVCDAYAKYNADTTRREFPYDILQRTFPMRHASTRL